jgi:hypothetical protein
MSFVPHVNSGFEPAYNGIIIHSSVNIMYVIYNTMLSVSDVKLKKYTANKHRIT